jgi:deoxyhypusine synthase
VFCPALTDGSLGDMMYFHTYKADPAPLNVDIVGDIRKLNDMSVKAKQAGMIILGGGVCKHQIANAMLFVRAVVTLADMQRNGADYAVYINTGQEVSTECTCEWQSLTRSTTGRTLALVPTRPSLGARFVRTLRASR